MLCELCSFRLCAFFSRQKLEFAVKSGAVAAFCHFLRRRVLLLPLLNSDKIPIPFLPLPPSSLPHFLRLRQLPTPTFFQQQQLFPDGISLIFHPFSPLLIFHCRRLCPLIALPPLLSFHLCENAVSSSSGRSATHLSTVRYRPENQREVCWRSRLLLPLLLLLLPLPV